ncbi:MAG: hypothetical protein J07HQW1_03086 [Haloquadratum walsbyi J07HQW1]|uniref:Uncharacterized protein n=1 Tax=Haloquadratum walsbyi J07HQW1 TaxID=1238424 RepID=U1N923_9EURY|nr:MAG: hypothetical protein J07HQW1_03086 [Haloquadratum walsbyi J07HQW1]
MALYLESGIEFFTVDPCGPDNRLVAIRHDRQIANYRLVELLQAFVHQPLVCRPEFLDTIHADTHRCCGTVPRNLRRTVMQTESALMSVNKQPLAT